MATIINPAQESIHKLSNEEATAYFEQIVRQFFNVSAEEYLKNREKYSGSPHYASVEFLIPLVNDSEK